MNRVIPIVALAAFLTTGFGFGPDPGEKEAPESEAEECDDACASFDGMDMTDVMIQNYTDGTVKAMYYTQLHDDPEPGQYWTTSSSIAGTTTSVTWQVVSVRDDIAVIEQRHHMSSEYSAYDYVIAYEIDLNAGEDDEEEAPEEDAGNKGEKDDEARDKEAEESDDEEENAEVEVIANVKKAWVGKTGKKPQEIDVMEVPARNAAAGAGNDGIGEIEESEFTNVALAGGNWSGTRTVTSLAGTKSEVWIADNGWFGGVIRVTSGDFVNELSKFGKDGEAFLEWPEDEEVEEEAPTSDDGKDDGEGETEEEAVQD